MSEKEETIIVVGISGVTCGGKTTTADKLSAFLPNCKVITQDDYYFDNDDPRHTLIAELNHVNYDILTSLDMAKMHKDVLNILNNKKMVKKKQNYKKITNEISDFHSISKGIKSAKLKVLIVEGFCIFNYEPLVPLFDLKYYFTLTKEECLQRREYRVYDPPDVPGYFELCAWPEHISQLEEVRTKVDDVKYFSGTNDSDKVAEIILRDIFSLYSDT